MTIGIVVSTELETKALVKKLDGKKMLAIQHKTFYTGRFKNTAQAAICICGVGKTNAAHGTTLLLEKFRPAFIFSIGVAGAYPSSGLNIGDIAVAEKEIYGDEGLTLKDGFHAMNTINLPLLSVEGTKYYNEFPLSIPEKLSGFDVKGNFVTVSSCSGTSGKGREMEKRFNAICENMEGAAIAHICALNRIPIAEVRGISNIVRDRGAHPLNKRAIIDSAKKVQGFFLDRLV